MNHKYQKQHRLAQIYLKQFGYKVDNEYWLSVLKIGTGITENLRIQSFTAETNIFDLPVVDDDNTKRHFEILSGKIENLYPTVISNLHNQGMLTGKNKDVLNHFVANLLCKTQPFRELLSMFLNDAISRNDLIKEVTMFSGDREEMKSTLDRFHPDFELNVFIGWVMNHLVNVFSNFYKVIIKDFGNNGWVTTDNPVFVEKQGHHEWLIPIEAEIYLPLSKDFCLFMFHPDSEQSQNPLRLLHRDKVNKIDFDTFDSISKQIGRNFHEYIILSGKIEPTKTS